LGANDGESYYHLAIGYFNLRKLDRAAEAFTQAEAKGIFSASLFHLRGQCREDAQNLAAAASDYDRALEIDAAYLPARISRGTMRHANNDWEGCIADLGWL
jgi:tetratricopeptide (TPR) repeat protein